LLRKLSLQLAARLIITDQADEDAASASEAILRATLPAPHIVSLRWTAMTGAALPGKSATPHRR